MHDPDKLIKKTHNCSSLAYCASVKNSTSQCVRDYCDTECSSKTASRIQMCDDKCILKVECQGRFFTYRRKMRKVRFVVQYGSLGFLIFSIVCCLSTALFTPCLSKFCHSVGGHHPDDIKPDTHFVGRLGEN